MYSTEEDVDQMVLVLKGYKQNIWIEKDFSSILLESMSAQHLEEVLEMCQRNPDRAVWGLAYMWLPKLRREQERRRNV